MKSFVALLSVVMMFASLSVSAQAVDLQKTDAPKAERQESNDVEVTTSQLPPVDDIIFIPCRMLSTGKMVAIIKKAAVIRDWIPVENGRNCVRCTLRVRRHKLVVDVIIAKDRLIIRYVDSENLNVNPAKRTIHRKYKGWIDVFTREIDKQAAVAQ